MRRRTPVSPTRALLAVAGSLALATGTLAALPTTAAAVDDPAVVSVDLSTPTGAVYGGATGTLYGLSDVGVPNRDLTKGFGPRTVAQKAPGGKQHPNGDADVIADDFFAADGEELSVYMQDDYTEWPYQDLGMDDYMPRITRQVTEIQRRPDADKFSYVLFNEPDGIWYQNWATERDNFFRDWVRAYTEVRRIDPDARIVGPNEARYNPTRLRDFLTFARDNDVLPDVMSWHELGTGSLRDFRGRFADYRALEKELGIDPLPININEYGNRQDTANPGRSIQWLSMFEDTKVDGNTAYWTFAGNLSDHTAQSSQANGGWWLGKWYSDLTGQTVALTPPDPNTVDTAQGIATLDRQRKQATVLVGGTAEDLRLDLTGLPRAVFGRSVDVRVSRVGFTGQEGAALAPAVVQADRLQVSRDGSVELDVPNDNAQHAYRVVVTPASGDAPEPDATAWSRSYEAEDARLTDAQPFAQRGDWDYAASRGADVGGLNKPTSAVTFTVDVPRAGTYTAEVLGGNERTTGQHAVYVNDAYATDLTYSATLRWTYRGKALTTLRLPAGRSTISLRTTGPDGAMPNSDITIDRLDLTAGSVENGATSDRSVTMLEDARLSGDAVAQYPAAQERRASLGRSGRHVTFVAVPSTGYYDVTRTLSGAGGRSTAALTLSGEEVEGARTEVDRAPQQVTSTVFLRAGITELTSWTPRGSRLLVGDTRVTRNRAADRATRRVEAETARPSGGATIEQGRWASRGAYVTDVGRGGTLTVARGSQGRSGQNVLTVGYANADRAEGHAYNTDVITRFLDTREEGGTRTTRSPYRHNYSWDGFWSVSSPIDLATSTRSLVLGNARTLGPNVDWVSVSPLHLDTRAR